MITTHVLDIAQGAPAVGVAVILEIRQGSDWTPVARGTTDSKGRLTTLTEGWPVTAGTYRLTFDLGDYQRRESSNQPFFPDAKVTFNIRDTEEDYHVPLLFSPFGYTTYLGT
jgi:5-hydroxyisourate hydrolase